MGMLLFLTVNFSQAKETSSINQDVGVSYTLVSDIQGIIFTPVTVVADDPVPKYSFITYIYTKLFARPQVVVSFEKEFYKNVIRNANNENYNKWRYRLDIGEIYGQQYCSA